MAQQLPKKVYVAIDECDDEGDLLIAKNPEGLLTYSEERVVAGVYELTGVVDVESEVTVKTRTKK